MEAPMTASRRLAALLTVLLLTAACSGGSEEATTTTTTGTTTTTTGATTSTAPTTTSSTGPSDTGPLAGLLADPVADPFGATGHHAMGYGDEARSFVVSQDTLTTDGGRLTLAPFDPAPATTGIAADQMLLEAWIEPSPGGVAPRAMVLYGKGAGGWNPYVTVDAASILAYLETTTDYTARRPAGPADVRTTPTSFDWTGSAHFVADVAVFAYPAEEDPAYQGEIECTFTGTLACATLSDDGILRPGDEGEAVTALQDALADLGYYGGAGAGAYDDETEEAVRLFQRDYRLSVDGKAGPQTQDLLDDVVSGNSDIVMASQDGVGEVLFGTPADTARPALNAIFGTPDSSTGWFASACSGDMWLEVTWGGFTAIFTDREGSRQFDGWHVDDLGDLPSWLYFAGGIRPSWRWSDFKDMGAGFDPTYGAFWYQHDLGYNNGRFVNPPSDPPAAGARIQSFGTGTGAFVSC
jgi:hypothetical protein